MDCDTGAALGTLAAVENYPAQQGLHRAGGTGVPDSRHSGGVHAGIGARPDGGQVWEVQSIRTPAAYGGQKNLDWQAAVLRIGWEHMVMEIDILTLFPESVDAMLNVSILGRAQERGHIAIRTHQIRQYTTNKQMQVDDYPYGGGPGGRHAGGPPLPLLGARHRRPTAPGAPSSCPPAAVPSTRRWPRS